MKIGLVCHGSLGGSGVVATELAEALVTRGHDVTVVSNERPPRLRQAKFAQAIGPKHELFPEGEYALALASRLAELDVDLLHVHYAIPHAVSAYLSRQLNKRPKLITTLHGTDVLTVGRAPALHPVLKLAIQSSDAVTTPTRYLAHEAAQTFAVTPHVIGNFVDTDRFAPAATGTRSRTLVHNSNFRPLKRVEDVVRIFARVLSKLPDAKLLLIGDGPTRPTVESIAKGLPNVTFAGEQRDVIPLLQQGAAFLFPSETESFGLAALEALSCGLPVIASRTGGLPELITHGTNGYLHEVGDVDAMAASALTALDNPALKKAARDSAITHWSPGPRIDAYEALYRSLL